MFILLRYVLALQAPFNEAKTKNRSFERLFFVFYVVTLFQKNMALDEI